MEQSSKINLNIPILLGICRTGRRSLKVAQFIFQELSRNYPINTEIIDLAEHDIPMLEKPLQAMASFPPDLVKFCSKLAEANGILMVVPEYKNGYPGVLKNALDYLEP